MVGELDDLAVVLDDEHGVAVVAQRAQGFLEQVDVLRVEADARLVEDVVSAELMYFAILMRCASPPESVPVPRESER